MGLARDCAHSLPRILGWITDFSRECSDWGYIFLENDSSDNTFGILQSFDATHQRGIVESLPQLAARIEIRSERLSYLRNRELDHLWKDQRLSAFDFAIVMDLDGINERFPRRNLLNHIKSWPVDCAAIFANQTKSYYDTWAFRHPVYSPDDCWKRIRERPTDMSMEQAVDTYIKGRRAPLPRYAGLLEVDSAFGGLALYRLSAIRGSCYRGLDSSGNTSCEHVEFHRQLRQSGFRLFIDTAMVNGTGLASHGAVERRPFAQRLWNRLSRQLLHRC